MAKDTCDVYCYDPEKVSRLKKHMDKDMLRGTSLIFKVLGDETRLKAAYALSKEEELCVCDVANILGSSVATASHHLRILKKHGLVKYRKEGKLAFYRLDDHHVRELIEVASEHMKEGKINE